MQKSSKVAACVAGCIMALIFIKKAIRSLKASGTRVFEDSVDHMTKLDSIVDRLTDGDGETASRAELADELYFYSKKMPDGQRMLKLETNFKIKGNSDSPSTMYNIIFSLFPIFFNFVFFPSFL